MRNGYLIGAIDHATPDDQNWKKLLDAAIKNSGVIEQQVTLFDPGAPWLLNGDYIHTAERRLFIEKVNRAAMDASDFAIVNLPKAIFSVGSIVEINQYFEEGKPIILATDIPYGQNVYLSNRVSPDLYFEYQKGATAVEVVAGLLDGLTRLMRDYGAEDSPDRQKAQSHSVRYHLRSHAGLKKSLMEKEATCAGNYGGSQKVQY